jgi:hypothetical protein
LGLQGAGPQACRGRASGLQGAGPQTGPACSGRGAGRQAQQHAGGGQQQAGRPNSRLAGPAGRLAGPHTDTGGMPPRPPLACSAARGGQQPAGRQAQQQAGRPSSKQAGPAAGRQAHTCTLHPPFTDTVTASFQQHGLCPRPVQLFPFQLLPRHVTPRPCTCRSCSQSCSRPALRDHVAPLMLHPPGPTPCCTPMSLQESPESLGVLCDSVPKARADATSRHGKKGNVATVDSTPKTNMRASMSVPLFHDVPYRQYVHVFVHYWKH